MPSRLAPVEVRQDTAFRVSPVALHAWLRHPLDYRAAVSEVVPVRRRHGHHGGDCRGDCWRPSRAWRHTAGVARWNPRLAEKSSMDRGTGVETGRGGGVRGETRKDEASVPGAAGAEWCLCGGDDRTRATAVAAAVVGVIVGTWVAGEARGDGPPFGTDGGVGGALRGALRFRLGQTRSVAPPRAAGVWAWRVGTEVSVPRGRWGALRFRLGQTHSVRASASGGVWAWRVGTEVSVPRARWGALGFRLGQTHSVRASASGGVWAWHVGTEVSVPRGRWGSVEVPFGTDTLRPRLRE